MTLASRCQFLPSSAAGQAWPCHKFGLTSHWDPWSSAAIADENQRRRYHVCDRESRVVGSDPLKSWCYRTSVDRRPSCRAARPSAGRHYAGQLFERAGSCLPLTPEGHCWEERNRINTMRVPHHPNRGRAHDARCRRFWAFPFVIAPDLEKASA